MRLLRRLSRRGVTVVLTTHEPASIDRCDPAYSWPGTGTWPSTRGSPAEARNYFGFGDLNRVYRATRPVSTHRKSGP